MPTPSVLFICPPTAHWLAKEAYQTYSCPFLGVLYVATYLKAHGFRAEVLDLGTDQARPCDVAGILATRRPDVVGLSAYTENYTNCLEIAREVKSLLPETIVVLGGPMPTFIFADVLSNPAVDFVVQFEGEQTMLELMRHLQDPASLTVHAIPGLAFRSVDGPVTTTRRPPIADLERLPFVDRDLAMSENYARAFPVLTSRGCPSNCTFCSSRAFWSRRCRFRSPENVVEELWDLTSRYPVEDFYFVDDTFTVSPRRVHRLCELMGEREIRVPWTCFSRVDTASEDLLAVMRDAGCRKIEFGVESADASVLRSINKKITTDQVTQAVGLCRKLGIRPLCYFMLGHVADTLTSMRSTVAYMQFLREEFDCDMQLLFNTPFPGTYQFENAKALGLTIHAKAWSEFRLNHPTVSTAHFTRDDLRALYVEAVERGCLRLGVPCELASRPRDRTNKVVGT